MNYFLKINNFLYIDNFFKALKFSTVRQNDSYHLYVIHYSYINLYLQNLVLEL